MRLRAHAFVSFVAAAVYWLVFKDLVGAAALFAGGFLTDFDHYLYALVKHGIPDPFEAWAAFNNGTIPRKETRHSQFLFHNIETIIVAYFLHPLLAVGILLHVFMDLYRDHFEFTMHRSWSITLYLFRKLTRL